MQKTPRNKATGEREQPGARVSTSRCGIKPLSSIRTPMTKPVLPPESVPCGKEGRSVVETSARTSTPSAAKAVAGGSEGLSLTASQKLEMFRFKQTEFAS